MLLLITKTIPTNSITTTITSITDHCYYIYYWEMLFQEVTEAQNTTSTDTTGTSTSSAAITTTITGIITTAPTKINWRVGSMVPRN